MRGESSALQHVIGGNAEHLTVQVGEVGNLSLVSSYDFGNLQVFAKAGASMLANRSHEYGADFVRMEGTPDADNTDWSVRPSFGLGAAYNFNKHFAIRTEWQHFKAAAGEHTVDMTSNLFTVGAQYKF